jgi:hypothetical protein
MADLQYPISTTRTGSISDRCSTTEATLFQYSAGDVVLVDMDWNSSQEGIHDFYFRALGVMACW